MYKLFSHLFWLFAVCPLSVLTCGCDSDEPTPDPEPIIPGASGTTLVKVSQVDYRPAPGQFVNEMPEYESGDTYATMNAKAMEAINNGDLVSLGAFGGSITVSLSQPIRHNPAYTADFRVLGNAYFTTNGTPILGSSEPGIVYVSTDINSNGIADDAWYELRGEKYDETERNVTITYTEPTDPTAAHWVLYSGAKQGSLTCNTAYHNHTYFPIWSTTREITVTAQMLPQNGFYEEGTSSYRQYCWTGYADSYPNSSPLSGLSLSSAVDSNGNHVSLDKIHFIRIVSAVLQSNGPLGECSTEVGGIQLLHD